MPGIKVLMNYFGTSLNKDEIAKLLSNQIDPLLSIKKTILDKFFELPGAYTEKVLERYMEITLKDIREAAVPCGIEKSCVR